LQVVGRAEFSPALNGGEAVPVWISVPVVFKTDGPGAAVFGVKAEGGVAEITGQRAREAEVSKPQRAPPAGYDAASIADAPTFTPYTVRPDITNRTEVARSLEEAYPRELRDEGIGGTANIWVFIDETGSVQRTVLDETYLLDEAALEVAEILEFTPALNRDKPVPVWISLPITFTTR
jgi:TonB family protein